MLYLDRVCHRTVSDLFPFLFSVGNEILHEMTNAAEYDIMFILYDQNMVMYFAMYRSFKVAAESERYRLTIGQMLLHSSPSPGKVYKQNVHNCMYLCNGGHIIIIILCP